MIVVCTGCSAKFKVADEKVGPKGAKLRCSRCQTVFLVRREGAEHAPPVEAPPAGPPPLPRRASTATSIPGSDLAPPSPELGAPVDARSAFEIDLEPAAPRGVEPDPFGAPPPPDDPFAAALQPEEPPSPQAPADPFGLGGDAAPDPFAAVQAPVPPELLRASPPAPAVEAQGEDPFGASLPPLGGVPPADDLALEERTTPPPRVLRPQSSAPLDDPFGGADDAGFPTFDGGHPADIPPMSHELPGEPFGPGPGGLGQDGPAPPSPRREAPLHVDPFAAAAVDADPLQVSGAGAARGAGVPTPAPAAAAAAARADADDEVLVTRPRALTRLRSAAVNAVSLLVLLVVAVALLVVWRGKVPLSEAVHPSAVLAALTHRDRPTAPFSTRHVTSGLYERARGAPLLFVRGEVVSHAGAEVPAVRVAVELVRAGAVVGRGEGVAGALLTPEELYGAADAAALAQAAADAAARAAPVRPGQAVPFLVALSDYPEDLSGVALRVRADGEAAR